ncbi:class I SAM-dependent RNA methyltransferase [Paraclostridium ghonii]|uniref:N6-adenine-specific DNA methylase n=1 Tax=Paraclostridium ghonii TaxID=29358 RepID=A0ABU0N1Q8_9FIRM|nr:class I SAM-dependent RNA methyltransferase [Paeniclostridium ghonii]MDQ0557055.1 putative N6-adenine-specific DNA methylase [Paeniclostridium ghonii]
MKNYTLITPCFFGIEKTLKNEISNLGYEIIKTEDGRVTYKTDEKGIAMSNIWLRTAERVLLKVAEFEAKTFNDLFESTKAINWAKYIPYGGEFPVSKASSIKSKLFSTSDIQSIVKKAVVESLKSSYQEDGMLPETKEKYSIQVFIHKDIVTITLDTSGMALHKRGYREVSTEAPLRETMASAMVQLTPWQPGRILVDPMCGSGTIVIEAAMLGLNMAPGLNREFISEKWTTMDKNIWWDARKEAFDKMNTDVDFKIYGYDIDKEAVMIAKNNAELAGVEDYVEFKVFNAKNFESEEKFGFIITNPPYGERLEDKQTVKKLYKDLGYAFKALKTWSYYMVTSYEDFENAFNKKATKKRKLYNGRLKTYIYQYIGPKPPKYMNNNK